MKDKHVFAITTGLALFLCSSAALADTSWFHDVPTSDPNYAYIADLYNLNKISGKGNGLFGPNDSLTRAQFVAMLEQAFHVPSQPNATIPFLDVHKSDWYYQHVVDAFANGITTGISATEFAPDAYLTKEQAALMLFHYLNGSLPPNQNAGQMDVSDTDPWAKTAVANIMAYGFRTEGISSVPYRSKDVMTRGQASALIDLAYHYVNKTNAPKLAPIPAPLPPANESNIIPNSDGSRMFVNISSGYRQVKDQNILALFKQVEFTVDSSNNVTVNVPDSGSLWWTLQSYSANTSWQGQGAKTITFSSPTDFEINLVEHSTGRMIVSVNVQYRNGQWYARYY